METIKCEKCGKEIRQRDAFSIFRKRDAGDFVEIDNHDFCSKSCLVDYVKEMKDD